jgi:predicted aspartyl protease
MIRGVVDDYGRPLIPIVVRHPAGEATEVQAWIDTGLTGSLLLTSAQIQALGLAHSSTIRDGLANGTEAVFDIYSCVLTWFGKDRNVEALAGAGNFALVGLGLLEDCELTIDYPARTVQLALADR